MLMVLRSTKVGTFTLPFQRKNITEFIRKVYLSYFKVPRGDKDKTWHHTKFVYCALKLSENGLKANQNT